MSPEHFFENKISAKFSQGNPHAAHEETLHRWNPLPRAHVENADGSVDEMKKPTKGNWNIKCLAQSPVNRLLVQGNVTVFHKAKNTDSIQTS
jgi:hypothetical protein